MACLVIQIPSLLLQNCTMREATVFDVSRGQRIGTLVLCYALAGALCTTCAKSRGIKGMRVVTCYSTRDKASKCDSKPEPRDSGERQREAHTKGLWRFNVFASRSTKTRVRKLLLGFSGLYILERSKHEHMKES